MPYKYFQPQQLTANEVNEYLMNQSVMVFASSAARASAVTAPIEGMVTYLQDTNTLWFYNGSAWEAVSTAMTFANAAARDSLLGASNLTGRLAYIQDVAELQYHNGSSWRAVANSTLTLSSGLLVYQSSWTTATYSGSWGSYSDPTWGPAKYYRSNDGIVHLRALVRRNNTTTNVVFTLPAGYRPPHAHLFAVAASGGVGRIDVSTNGEVSWQGTQAGSPNPADWVSLFEVKFGVF